MSDETSATPPVSNETVQKVKTLLETLWRGDVPLFQTFWIYYFIGVFVLQLLGALIPPLGVLFGALSLIWAGFMVRPILLAADKYTGEKHWAMAAKIAAILIVIGVLGSLFS